MTYNQIQEVAQEIENAKQAQKVASTKLASSLEISVLLLKIQSSMSDESTEVLRQALSIASIDD
jgi:hypothetical protein